MPDVEPPIETANLPGDTFAGRVAVVSGAGQGYGRLIACDAGVPAETARFTKVADMLRQTREKVDHRIVLIHDLFGVLGSLQR